MKHIIHLLLFTLLFSPFLLQSNNTQTVRDIAQRNKPHKILSQQTKKGSLTVICGSMCSGKSEELIRQIARFILAGLNVLVFKPTIVNEEKIDLNIDPLTYISSRSGSWVDCFAVSNSAEMQEYIDNSQAQIIAIDEVMLFTTESKNFIQLIRSLVNNGKTVIIAGLDLDFRGEPFGPMPELLAFADHVVKLTAICSVCNNDTYCLTQRLVNGQPAHYNDPLIIIDSAVGSNHYEPRCRACHVIRKD